MNHELGRNESSMARGQSGEGAKEDNPDFE